MITTTLTVENKQHYLFRYEAEVEGSHGRTSIYGAPFHVTLTMPQGNVVISKYGYKENTQIEVAPRDIETLIQMLQAARTKYESVREVPSGG